MERKTNSHKGENGKVGIIGGSIDYSGAPALSAQASMRTGSDLVKVLTSDSVKDVVRGYSENLIVDGYDSKYFGQKSMQKAERLEEWSDVLVVGPGLSCARQDLLKQFIEDSQTPMVIDAEAIQTTVRSDISNAILTPHEGEAELIRNKYGTIEEFIELKEDVVVILKGSTDKIYSSEGVEEVSGGHPGMTVGGTGDVLTGIIAGLISQGMSKKKAAVKAAEVNGSAGEKAAEEYGNGLLATDLFEEIPKTLFLDE